MKAWVKGIIAGAIIAVIGIAVLIGGLYMNGWKFPNVYYDFEMRTFTAENENTDLVLDIDAGVIKTEYTDEDKIIIDYPYSEKYEMQITEENGKLTLSHPEQHFKISFSSCNTNIPTTTIKLPRGKIYNMDIDMSAGTISLSDGDYGEVSIKMNAGTIKSDAINCQTFYCNMNAGTLSLENLNCKDFTYKINAGTVKVKSLVANNTKITMNAGTINLGFNNKQEEYTIRKNIDAGSFTVNGNRAENQNGTTEKVIDVSMNAGTVKLTFAEA